MDGTSSAVVEGDLVTLLGSERLCFVLRPVSGKNARE
jgi:hypothetical protein